MGSHQPKEPRPADSGVTIGLVCSLDCMDFTDTDVETLVHKIEGLDLSPPEQAALSALVAAAEEANDDVAGFGAGPPIGIRMFNVLGVTLGSGEVNAAQQLQPLPIQTKPPV